MKLTHIADFKLGRSVQGFYLCKEKHLRHTRNNDLYMDLTLADATGIILAKMWNLVDSFQNRFERGDPVAVKGKVSEFNDILQLTITQINRASLIQYGQYGFSPNKLVRTVDESIADLWKRLSKITKTIKSPLKELVTTILKKYKAKIQTMPASVNHHHPLSGGFLKHLVTTAEISMEILTHYPDLDINLSMAGVILHDIGKVKSINDDLMPAHTDEGELMGYMVLGRDIILDEVKSINNFPRDILVKLEHIILSHQGSSEEGAVTVPQFPEALFVHYIDELDGKLNLMLDEIANNPNHEWINFQSIFKAEMLKNKNG